MQPLSEEEEREPTKAEVYVIWKRVRVKNGLCVCCKAFALEGKAMCAKHIEQSRRRARDAPVDRTAMRNKRRQSNRKALGSCTKCLSPAVEGKTLCDKHHKASRLQEAKRYAECKASGLCTKCKTPVIDGKTMCATHLEAMRMRAAKRKAKATP